MELSICRLKGWKTGRNGKMRKEASQSQAFQYFANSVQIGDRPEVWRIRFGEPRRTRRLHRPLSRCLAMLRRQLPVIGYKLLSLGRPNPKTSALLGKFNSIQFRHLYAPANEHHVGAHGEENKLKRIIKYMNEKWRHAFIENISIL